LWIFALMEFSFAVKNFLEGLAQESEQFVRGLELQPLAGIDFLHRSFKLASCGVRMGSKSYYKSSSHNGEGRMIQKLRCEVSIGSLWIFRSGRYDIGQAKTSGKVWRREGQPKRRVAGRGSRF
jgi:hypothetical protein